MEGKEYIGILAFAGTGTLFLLVTFLISKALRPDKPDPEKLSVYECGEESVLTGQIPFNSGFFVIALIFVLFEVELIFLFPWAVVFDNKELSGNIRNTWLAIAIAEMVIFVLVLFAGLIYAWAHGHLDWIKPEAEPTRINSKIPLKLYDLINTKYSDSNNYNK